MRKASAIIVSIILLSAICFNTTGCKGEASQPERTDSTSVSDSIEQDAAAADTNEETPMPTAADMLFEDFIFNFASNRKLQTSRIKFPLPVIENGNKTFINKRQWPTEHFFIDNDYYTLIFGNRKQMNAMNDTAVSHVTLENILFDQKSIKQYKFNRIGGKWMLTEVESMPISESQNASFLDFYERFAVDNEFQIESMNDIVEFSAPDPDNDFASMSGTLLPDQWPAFKPEFLPTDSLYNFIYGGAIENTSQRIFIIEGLASGMRTEMTFRLKNGKWVLTKFNS